MSLQQIPLAVTLSDQAHFDNFYVSDANSVALQSLRQFSSGEGEASCYLFGAEGTGKSHILQALCHLNSDALYFPLAELKQLPAAEIFEGLAGDTLICLDDIDAVLGDKLWDESLFHLFNRVRENNGRWICSAAMPVFDLSCLPDLKSRLGWGLVHQLKALDDQQLIEMLQLRAQHRGLELPTEVATYLMSRTSRAANDLIEVLGKLDGAALQAQRRLTIPFVRQALGWAGE